MPFNRGLGRLSLEIIIKMDHLTLCRLRQTCKVIDVFVEENRFEVAKRASICPCTLRILIGGFGKKPMSVSVLPYHFSWRGYRGFQKDMGFDDDLEFVELSDPYIQLSTISFDHMYLRWEGHDPEELPAGVEWDDQHCKIMEELFLPLLRKLKPRCSRLSPYGVLEKREYYKLIDFKKLDEYRRYETADEYEPFLNCTEHYVGYFDKPPENLSTLMRHLEVAKVGIDKEDDPEAVLEGFLKDISQNPQHLGNLKHLILAVYFGGEKGLTIANVPGLEYVWDGYIAIDSPRHPEDFHLIFHKLPIGDGMAVIAQDGWYYDVYFATDCNRSTLCDLLGNLLFTRNPFDFSASYDKFMTAADDRAAFDCFYKNFVYENDE